jgi:hypothetical protein
MRGRLPGRGIYQLVEVDTGNLEAVAASLADRALSADLLILDHTVDRNLATLVQCLQTERDVVYFRQPEATDAHRIRATYPGGRDGCPDVQRWTTVLTPKTSLTADDRAFAPSTTTSNPSSASSPRSTRSARRCFGHGLVLRRAFPQPDRNLRAIGGDGQRHHAAVLAEVHPVDHQHRDAATVNLRERWQTS